MNLREARMRADLTQAELARKLGLTQGTVYSWEKKRRVPEKYAEKLSQVLQKLHTSVGKPAGYREVNLADSISKARRYHGLSQAALGQRLGVSQGAVYNWEKKGRVPEKHIAGLSRVLSLGSFNSRGDQHTSRKPISAAKRYRVMKRDGFACVKCGSSGREARLEIDHKKPVAAGGTDSEDNLQTLCQRCNRGKRDDIE
jgi:DNA-binding transcriptional regulator YiaG